MHMRTCVALVALGIVSGCSSLGDDPFPKAIDAGEPDARVDGRVPDASPPDAAPPDASPPDASPSPDATAVNDRFKAMPSFARHLFICVNERAPGHPKGCCADKDASQVRDAFKKRLAEVGLHGIVRANKSGCLDQCAAGVALVVYPEQVWYGGVTLADVNEIVDSHIIGGSFVRRLMLPDQLHLDRATGGPALTVSGRAMDGDVNA